MPSFDVVSEVNLQEVLNAVDQVKREIGTRYDFKDSKSTIDLKDTEITIVADDQMKLKAIQELLKQKLAKRGVSLKSVSFEEAQPAGGDLIRQLVKIKQGLDDEQLRRVNKLIKASGMKVTSQIQGNQLRISGKKKDDLQAIIAHLRSNITDIELQYINFRD